MDTWWSFEFFFCLSFRLLFSCVYVFEEDHTCKVVNFFFSLFSLGSFLFEFLFFLHFVTLGFVVVDVNFLLIYTTFAITRRKRVVYIVYIFFFCWFLFTHSISQYSVENNFLNFIITFESEPRIFHPINIDINQSSNNSSTKRFKRFIFLFCEKQFFYLCVCVK